MSRPPSALDSAREGLHSLRWALGSLEPRHAAASTAWWLREPLGRRTYRVLSENELLRTRRSETAFVFGSGATLQDIDGETWRRIAEFDTVAFSHFHRQRWVRVDYHLVVEAISAGDTAASIRSNPMYADTVFGMAKGWIAHAPNELVARRLLPVGARLFRWRRIGRGRVSPASTSLRRGLVHGDGSIQDAVNFALVMGYRRIVVAGADLSGTRYFWMPPGDDDAAEPTRWQQAATVISSMKMWREAAAVDGVELLVYDERSALAEALPVFSW